MATKKAGAPDHLREIAASELIRKRLAKYMAKQCFRNTKLEDLHAGNAPVSRAGDYSDVKVVTPDREIAWTELSRFNDDEMKSLMIDVVNHCDLFLKAIFDRRVGAMIVSELQKRDYVPYWND